VVTFAWTNKGNVFRKMSKSSTLKIYLYGAFAKSFGNLL